MKVFVYGTLKQGFGNHVLFGNSTVFTGPGKLIGAYTMLDLYGFPGVIKTPASPEQVIIGEVYDVNHETMQRLDQLEGNGSFYNREIVTIYMDNGEEEEAWVYFLMDSEDYRYPEVESTSEYNGSPAYTWRDPFDHPESEVYHS